MLKKCKLSFNNVGLHAIQSPSKHHCHIYECIYYKIYQHNLPIDDSNTKTAIIGSLMVNSVCLNNVPSLVLLKVFAKFNTLKENTNTKIC